MSVVTSTCEAGRLVLTICRPERRNALNAEVIAALRQALLAAQADRAVQAVVLTGAGDEAFCAGADLAGGSFEFDYATPTIAYADLLRTASTLTVPLVARVNGACMAGGMGLLAMCDLAVAARHASFGLPEAKVGVFPMQVLALLQAQVPQRQLARLCLTGDPISAERAHELGIVNRVTEPGGAVDAALELAGQIARNGPLALAASKKIVASALDWDEAEAWQKQGELTGPVFASEDAREGAVAFAEKRDPVWKGK